MRFFAAVLMASWLPMQALAVEMEVTIYYQPDSGGGNTERNEIVIDDGELKVERSADRLYRIEDREASAKEIEMLLGLIRARVAAFEPDEGERLDYPRLEVKMEIEGVNHALEIEERYPVGGLPERYVDLQKMFFETVFE